MSIVERGQLVIGFIVQRRAISSGEEDEGEGRYNVCPSVGTPIAGGWCNELRCPAYVPTIYFNHVGAHIYTAVIKEAPPFTYKGVKIDPKKHFQLPSIPIGGKGVVRRIRW